MRDLGITVNKLWFWIVPVYLSTAALDNHRVEAYDLIDKPGYFKFVAAVQTDGGICTGTIVHKDWILTAAHCVYLDDEVIGGDRVLVMAGITNYQYPQPDSGQLRSGTEVKVHPRFWIDKLAKFDIALVKLNESLEFNEWVGNISVAGDAWPAFEEVDNCMSLGYGGYVGNTSPVKSLKVWNVTAAYGPSNCPCARRFQYRRLVCAKNADYARLCRGDDGGPLVCGNVVRGIAHMVRNWYVCRENPMYPQPNCVGSPERGLSIYMLLCPFNDWMHGIVVDIPPTPATCGTASTSLTVALLGTLFIVHAIVLLKSG